MSRSRIGRLIACAMVGFESEAYARWRHSEVGATTERLERRLILDLLGEVSGRKLLDVGCGDGDFAVELSRRGALVTGIDASTETIAAAQRRVEGDRAAVALLAAPAERLPFAADQFDLVTAITILCFVEDPRPVFREIARVLRPDGCLVIGELGKWSAWAAKRRIRAWLGSPLWRRARFRTASEIGGLAEQAGLGVEQVRGAVFYPRWRLAARLLGRADSALGRRTTIGAAFIAVAARKPRGVIRWQDARGTT
jgi:SAM-dependent methyltransferase